MKKIQYVKLVGLLTILLFLNISCKDDDTLLRGSRANPHFYFHDLV